MRKALLILPLLFWWCQAFGVPPVYDSPDRRCRAEIIDRPMRGVNIEVTPFTLRLICDGVVVAQHPTMGFLIGAEWSPDGKFVAINNRRGHSGDYLWIFTLPGGRCLKTPDDKHGGQWQGAALLAVKQENPDATDRTLTRVWLTAEGWNGERLLVGIRARYDTIGSYDCEASVEINASKLNIGEMQVSKVPPSKPSG